MNAKPVTHPAPEQLAAFGLGKLNEADSTSVSQHIEGCEACRRTVEGVSADTFASLVRSARKAGKVAPSAPTPAPAGSPQLPPAAAPAGVPPELASHPKLRIVRELGRGGMGVVYLAEHRLMKRSVAIKVINQNLLDRPQTLERFRIEVETAAQLDHPNIVRAHDAERVGSLNLLVMEYVERLSLSQVVQRKGPLPVAHACSYVRQAALGLQHAFEKKTVHRDLKPQNLMLTPKGQVKILDFGLARVARERVQGTGLTQEGAVMGTPDYLAPEQAMDARTADIRADIYSLGCTLYYLLTGRPPFRGETPMQVILAHMEKEAPPLTEVRPEVPPELSAVVARMMAKDPAQRYQKPVEVAQALAPFCKPGQKAGPATPPPVPPVAAPTTKETMDTTGSPWEELSVEAAAPKKVKRRAPFDRRWLVSFSAPLAT
jgi:serine/threonine protein kinase